MRTLLHHPLSLAVVGLLSFPASPGALAQNNKAAASDAQKTAYELSIKCYVANAYAASDRRYGVNGTAVAQFQSQAQKSYRYIVQLGQAIARADALVREDIDSFKAVMTGSFKREPKAFEQVRGQCVQFGLM